MDIYFCDLCGVRVSDADLRAGHGIRSHWDVICGTCLEMGHGKDWLSQRSKPKAAAASPTLDAARDRVATLEEEAPAPVSGRPIRAMTAAPLQDLGTEPTPSDAHPALSETDLTSTTRVPTPARAEPMHLAAAANMFSALGQTPTTAAKTAKAAPPFDDTDDLTDNVLAPTLPEDVTPARGTPAVTDPVSPFGFGGNGEKDETVAGLAQLPDTSDDLALDEEPKPVARDKPSSGTSSRFRKAGAGSRTGRGPAGRGAPARGNDGKSDVKPGTKSTSAKPNEAKASEGRPAAGKPSDVKPSPLKASDVKPSPLKAGDAKSADSKTATAKPPSKSSGKSSSKHTARSRRPAGKDSGRMVMIGSVISLVVMGIIFLVIMQMRQPEKRKVMVGTDLSELTTMVQETEKQVNAALRNDDLSEMEAALAKLNDTAQRIPDFEETARKNGESDDKVEGALRRLNWNDVYMQGRPLRDRISVKKQQQK